MRIKALRAAGVLAAVIVAAAACSSNGNSGGDGETAGSTVKVGLLSPTSGPAAASFTGAEPAVKARFEAYKGEGGKCSDTTFELVTADDQSTPQGALAGAQKLIQQDKVYSMLEVTPYFFGAAQYLTTGAKGTPVIGGAFDSAPQWLDGDNNLFGANQVPNFENTYTTLGDYMKKLGVTKVAAVAYDNKASRDGMDQALRSADAAGIDRAYVNDTIPLGSTDVGAIVLGIKNSGADGLYLPINADTALAIATGLRQAGVTLKTTLSATGYGADLLASPPSVQAGQGVTFISLAQPVETNTPSTERMANALKKYAGSTTGVPSFSNSVGWLSADLLIHGLETAGCDAPQGDLISKLRTTEDWNGGGLFPTNVSFSDLSPDKSCNFMLTLQGDGFVPQPDATPICGDRIT